MEVRIVNHIIDCDNFIVGNSKKTEFKPFGYNIPKVSAYLKESGKRFEELTDEELSKLK